MVAVGLGPASAVLGKPKTKPSAARTRLRRARARLCWFALNADGESLVATFMSPPPQRSAATATFGFRKSYLNAWRVERSSGDNRLGLRSLKSQVSNKTLASSVLDSGHLR